MFYSKGRLASSDRAGPICIVHSFLSRQRLRNGHMFVCRTGDTRRSSVEGVTCRRLIRFGEELVAETSSERLAPCWRDSEGIRDVRLIPWPNRIDGVLEA